MPGRHHHGHHHTNLDRPRLFQLDEQSPHAGPLRKAHGYGRLGIEKEINPTQTVVTRVRQLKGNCYLLQAMRATKTCSPVSSIPLRNPPSNFTSERCSLPRT